MKERCLNFLDELAAVMAGEKCMDELVERAWEEHRNGKTKRLEEVAVELGVDLES